jgi:hypothetical protein
VKGQEILALKNGNGNKFIKTDIFIEPVSIPKAKIEKFTPEKVLLASLNEFGNVELNFTITRTNAKLYSLNQAIRILVSKQTNFITFNPTNGYDGNIEYENKMYLSNDLIPIDYDSMLNNEVLLRYHPIQPAVGTYQIQFTCYDRNRKSEMFNRILTVNP